MATNNSSNIRTGVVGTVLQGQGVGSDLALSTATYPATTTINQLLYSSAANTIAGLATANQGVLTTGATGIPVMTALATNGQLIIGSTAGVPAAATLTAGNAMAITNGSNSIGLNVTGGGFNWVNVTGTTQSFFSRQGYFANNASQVNFTVGGINIGDAFKVVGKGAGGWRITPSATVVIVFGTSSTTPTTGYIESSHFRDCVEIIASSATEMIVINSVGDITIV